MKIKIEGSKLTSLVETSMIKKGATITISSPVFRFTKKYLASMSTGGRKDIASVIVVKPEYFDEYDITDAVNIPFEKDIIDEIKSGFKNPTEFTVKDNKLFGDDTVDTMEADLRELTPDDKFPLPLTQTKYGLLPDSNKLKANEDDLKDWKEENALSGLNIYKTTVDALKLPDRDVYELAIKNGKMVATMPKTNLKRSRVIEGEVIVGKKGRFLIDGDYYKSVVSNLNGVVYLIYDSGHVIFTCEEDNITKSFAVATRIET